MLEEEYGSGMDFRTNADTSHSPLAKKLFKPDGVTGVFFGSDFISVTKDDAVEWNSLKPQIFETIMNFYAENQPAVTSNPVLDHGINEDDTEVVMMIKELLDTRIRPAVHEDGGDIFFHGFDEETGVVSLQMAGSCSGCPSSSVTLKHGVENMLMHYVPEVKGVFEVVDEGIKTGEEEFETFEARLAEVKKEKAAQVERKTIEPVRARKAKPSFKF